MRTVGILVAAFAGLAMISQPAVSADGTTMLVVPGRPGVPEMYFGRDISWAVVEGEMGLDRPGNPVTIIPARPPAYGAPNASGYFPSTGRAPASGRLEVEPPANRALPPPAESYHRQWGAESAHTPVTVPTPYDASAGGLQGSAADAGPAGDAARRHGSQSQKSDKRLPPDQPHPPVPRRYRPVQDQMPPGPSHPGTAPPPPHVGQTPPPPPRRRPFAPTP
jgi:hypothetical protein